MEETVIAIVMIISGVIFLFATSWIASYLINLYDMEWDNIHCGFKENLKHFISMIGR